MQASDWPRIAVMGAGAVGCYFGGMLARAGAPVTLIGRPTHFEAITRHGLHLDTLTFQDCVAVKASTDVAAVATADLVLLTVKTLDTEAVARELAPHLSSAATLVSMQNGVDNVERIRSATGLEAVAAGVYVAVAMSAPGRVKHTGRGDLVIGRLKGQTIDDGRLRRLADTFRRAQVPCAVSDNVEGALWTKLVMNCTYNAISALGRAKYGRIVHTSWTRELMRLVTEEVLAVAAAAGIRIEDANMLDAVYKLGDAMAGATSSTAQDIARGKRTEIDALNGHVVRRGAELGVPTPVNQSLHALVKLLEEGAT